MPRILRNLKIMEVSGVDRGAGEGVKVMLMKRHGEDAVDKIWKTNADLPDAVKGALPDEAQSVFRRVANDRLGAGQSDESAIKQAWTAVKNGWSKQGDKWVRKDGVEKVAAALLDDITRKAWADDFLEVDWRKNADLAEVEYLKREFSEKERAHLADTGAAMSGGGFPIKSEQDLKNAIRAIGRAKNPGAARAHIKERASAIGHSDLIPDTWKRDDDAIDFGKLREAVGNMEVAMTEAELQKMIEGVVAKMLKNVQSESSGTLHSGGGKKGKEDAMPKGKVGAAAHSDAGEEEGENDEKVPSEKAFTLPADIEKRLADAEADRKILKQLQDEREAASFAKRAKSIGLAEADGAVMRKAYNGDTEAQAELDKRIEQINKRADEFARTGRIFKEFGSAQPGESVTAYDELMAKAAEIKKADPKLSEAQAFDKAMTDPANRHLAARESSERMAKINRTHAN